MNARRDWSVLFLLANLFFSQRVMALPQQAGGDPAKADLVYGQPIRFHNLTLVPVGTRNKGPFAKYTLLEQGLSDRSLAVREMEGSGSQAQVNQVEVRNSGHQPVYLLGGEMILGGKQDRIIQQDTVLLPSGEWQKVAVFCVEHGRWQGQSMEFSASGAMAHVALRTAALSGSQGAVWAEVSKNNQLHGTQSQTDTYRRTVQNEALRAKIDPYRKQLTGMLPKDLTLSGFVLAINGDIRVADLFGNPVLFGDLQGKLLSSYILEALGQQENLNAPPVSPAAAQSFVGKARAAKKDAGKASGGAMNYKMEDQELIGSETIDSRSGGSVRESYTARRSISALVAGRTPMTWTTMLRRCPARGWIRRTSTPSGSALTTSRMIFCPPGMPASNRVPTASAAPCGNSLRRMRFFGASSGRPKASSGAKSKVAS
jgi:hypothetical protein